MKRMVISGLTALLVLVGGACDRNTAPFEPGEQAEEPDLSRIFPAAENAQPGRTATAGSTERKPVAQATGRTGAVASGPGISGEIRLSSGAVPLAGATLFVIARSKGRAGGPPLAVLRVPNPTFPSSFEIGPGNVMIPSMKFEGEIDLSARLDTDGNAMTKAATDLAGRLEAVVTPGTTGVEIELAPSSQ